VETIIKLDLLKTQINLWIENKEVIALVPTMGALHEGHLLLIKQAHQAASKVIVSIFVNPKQFGPSEDFQHYPRTLGEDIRKLEQQGQTHLLFAPNIADIYHADFSTYIFNHRLAHELCGRSRPQHFQGVLTIVSLLFNLLRPNKVYFGKKDYQQWKLIEYLVRDLQFPVKVFGCKTVREENGLALSSRHQYLSPSEHLQAKEIYKSLQKARQQFLKGERKTDKLIYTIKEHLIQHKIQIDYIEIRSQAMLETIELITSDNPALALIAGWCGKIRLIDNLEFSS